MLTKDPSFGILSYNSGKITQTYKIEWPRVYSIFDNDDLSNIQNDQLVYQKIRESVLYAIAARPAILPYTDVVKCIVDHTNPKYPSFSDSTGSQLATFSLEVFIRSYALKPAL